MKVIFTFHYDMETNDMMYAGNATLAEAAKILSTRVFDLLAEARQAQEDAESAPKDGAETEEKGLDK